MDTLDTFDGPAEHYRIKPFATTTSSSTTCATTTIKTTTSSARVHTPSFQACPARDPFFRPLLKNVLHRSAYEFAFLPPKTFSSVVGRQLRGGAGNRPLSSASPWWWWGSGDAEESERVPTVKEQKFLDYDDLGVYYVRKFLHFQRQPSSSRVRWFHLIVRASTINSFFEELEKYNEGRTKVFLLEHSCWCDGSSPQSDENSRQPPVFSHHRHFVAVAEDGQDFKARAWSNVRCAHSPSSRSFVNTDYKICRTIFTWTHLRNILYYVSSLKSRCIFSARDGGTLADGVLEDGCSEPDDGAYEQFYYGGKPVLPAPVRNHFYVFAPLSFRFKVCVALAVFDNAESVQETIATLKGRCSASSFAGKCRWMRHPITGRRAYGVRIRDVVREKELRYLFSGEKFKTLKMYAIRRLKSVRSAAAALRKDANREGEEAAVAVPAVANVSGIADDEEDEEAFRDPVSLIRKFFEILGDYYWFPPAHFQKILREVVPLTLQVENLKKQLENAKYPKETDTKNDSRDVEEKWKTFTRRLVKDHDLAVGDLKLEFAQFVAEKWRPKEKELLEDYVKKMEEVRSDFFNTVIK